MTSTMKIGVALGLGSDAVEEAQGCAPRSEHRLAERPLLLAIEARQPPAQLRQSRHSLRALFLTAGGDHQQACSGHRVRR